MDLLFVDDLDLLRWDVSDIDSDIEDCDEAGGDEVELDVWVAEALIELVVAVEAVVAEVAVEAEDEVDEGDEDEVELLKEALIEADGGGRIKSRVILKREVSYTCQINKVSQFFRNYLVDA